MVLTLLSILALLAGLYLLRLGLRGRYLDAHPLCRHCGYDLLGLTPDTKHCSECGSDLWTRDSIVIGHRVKRIPLLLAAALLLSVTFFTSLRLYINARHIDTAPYKPLWLLIREASADAQTVSRRISLSEITKRLLAGKLSQSQVDDLIDRTLRMQKDGTGASPFLLARGVSWDPLWGDFLETAQLVGKVPFAKWQQYLEHSVTFGLDARLNVRRGDPLPLQLFTIPRCADQPSFDCIYKLSLEIDGRPAKIQPPPGRQDATPVWYSDWPSLQVLTDAKDPAWAALADGTHKARVTIDLLFYNRPRPRVTNPPSPPVTQKRIVLEIPWTLVPANQSTVRLNTDPGYRPILEQATAVQNAELCDLPGGTRLRMEWSFKSPDSSLPIALSYRPFARLNQREWPLEPVLLRAGRTLPCSWSTEAPVPGLDANRIDIILRPYPEQAAKTLDITEIWSGEILLPNVVIHRPN